MAKLGSKEFDIHEYMGEATVEILLGMQVEYQKSFHVYVQNFANSTLSILQKRLWE